MAYGDDESCDRDDRTIYVGQLPDKITKDILYELFFQAGENNSKFLNDNL